MSARRRSRKIRASKVFNRILRMTLVPWLKYKYRLRAENLELVRKTRPPFLLLPNHTSVWDPFMVNGLIPYPVHYVVTDASFRSRLVAFGLSLVGSIPKTKTMSDMDAMRNIMAVKERGGVIGIFPEGQNTWDGHSLPLVHSTAKLAKVLRIPVVTARVSGAYFSKPRWSKSSRRGRVNVRFDLAFSPEDLRTHSPEEIDRKIAELLSNDEYEYNRKKRVKFIGRDRAEYLERALFVCPSCTSIGSLRSSGNEFSCQECGYSVHYTLYGTFRGDQARFTTIRDWNLWQMKEFEDQLDRYLGGGESGSFLTDEGVQVQIGYRSRPLAVFGVGRIDFNRDRIAFTDGGTVVKEFTLSEIRGSNVQNNEHWEFYCGADLFRLTILDPRGCTYKWDLAVTLTQSKEKSGAQ